ncbi:zinc transporter ZIP4 [Aplochiton taeniatus]
MTYADSEQHAVAGEALSPPAVRCAHKAQCVMDSSVGGSSALEDLYTEVLSIVSPGQTDLNEEGVRSLFKRLENRVQCGVSCGKCHLAESVDQLIHDYITNGGGATGGRGGATGGRGGVVSMEAFPRLAAGCVLYLSFPALTCTSLERGRWGDETDEFIRRLQTLLEEIEKNYKPQHHQACVTADDIIAEVNVSSTLPVGVGQGDVGVVLGNVLYHALEGHCFNSQSMPEEGYFLDYIIDRLGSDQFTVTELETLMKSLKLGHENHDEEDHHPHHHGDDHSDHSHQELSDQSEASHLDQTGQSVYRRLRRRKNMKLEAGERNSSWDQVCFSAQQLVQIHSVNGSGPTRSSLARVSPALVQQMLSGACSISIGPTEPANTLTMAERYVYVHEPSPLSPRIRDTCMFMSPPLCLLGYVYALVANLLICLTSMFGIVVLLCTSCSGVFQISIQFCISLAVGSLTGDAVLHLLPMVLGLHVHADGSSRHTEHGAEEEDHGPYIYKLLVLLAGIYYFYLMETIFSIVTHKDKHHHHPHHHGEDSDPHHCDHGKVLEMYQQERKSKQSTSHTDLVDTGDSDVLSSNQQERTREQRLLPYMITLGDGIHNFADGLAIGAAFSASWKTGLATSLAVLCHELPHELGDFAILLHCGVSVRRALLLNVGSSLTSFIGLFISLSIATDASTQQWIGAITAGLFLYVGLADMLPAMIHVNSRRPWMLFILQNMGLLSGWGILLLLSLYEDRIGV